jgi:dephospho-CoA kinase
MIIGLTGGMASGKRTICDLLKEKGFIRYTFSDILSEELKKKNMPVTRENQQDLGNEIRELEGSGGLAKRLISLILSGNDYVIDGIRNPGEIIELRKQTDFVLIAINSPQKLRFERIVSRGMERDPKTWEDFLKVDTRDFYEQNPNGIQVGKCIEMADYFIVNDCSIEEFSKKFLELFDTINKDLENKR